MAIFQPTFTDGTQIIPSYASDPFVTGYHYEGLSATTFSISAGAARAYASNYVIAYPDYQVGAPSSMTVNTATIGALGCYPFAPADVAATDDTAFGIYVLGNTSGTPAPTGADNRTPVNVARTTCIVATGDNFLLPGYDVWRRIGTCWFDNGTNNLKFMTQSGTAEDRYYQLQTGLLVINAASSQVNAIVNLSTGDAPCNPAFVERVSLQASYNPAAAANILNVVPSTVSSSLNPIRIKGQTDAVALVTNFNIVPDVNSGDTSVYYLNTGAGDAVSIWLTGFEESLGLQAV